MGLSVSEMQRLLLYPASATHSPLTFKLLPRCGPRDEQKCHCVMTNKQCLYLILIPLFFGRKKKRKKEERSICILEKRGLEKPPAHTENRWLWRLEMWHRATNKSQSLKGYTLVFSALALCEQSLVRTHTHTHIHTQKPSGHSLFKQHVPIKSLPPLPSPASPSLRAHITGLTDSAGAETLPQLWRSALVSNTDPCAISHRWLPFHAAW